MAQYPVQNNQVSKSLQVYAKAMDLFADIVLLAHNLRNSRALVLDDNGAVVSSAVTDDTLEGANAIINQLSIVADGQSVAGAEAWQQVTAALIALAASFPDDYAAFMQISSEAAR